MYINHQINWTIHDSASTVITACKSRLSTNKTKTLQVTFTIKETNRILNLSLIFHNPANKLKFNQLKQWKIKQGHRIWSNSHENLNFSQYKRTEISCQNTKNIHHTTSAKNAKCVYIIDSSSLNLSFSFLVESSVAIGKSKPNNGPTTVIKIFNNESILVKYPEDSVHNLFTTNCWSTFQSKVQIFEVKNTQNAYLNWVETKFLSIFSLGKYNKWLYFINICANHTNIHTAIQIIHAKANNDTLKLAPIRKIMENIRTEIKLENWTNHELNVSWNATKTELQTCIKFVHKK